MDSKHWPLEEHMLFLQSLLSVRLVGRLIERAELVQCLMFGGCGIEKKVDRHWEENWRTVETEAQRMKEQKWNLKKFKPIMVFFCPFFSSHCLISYWWPCREPANPKPLVQYWRLLSLTQGLHPGPVQLFLERAIILKQGRTMMCCRAE